MSNAEGPFDGAMSSVARDWVVRLASRDIDEAELGRFRAWHAASPAHAQAFRRERDQWAALERTRTVFKHAIESDRRVARKRGRLVMTASGMAAAAVLFVIALQPFTTAFADHATSVAELDAVRLEDGSIAWLNSDSAIDVNYTDAERRVRLLDGEAWFDVEKMPSRRFVVDVDGTEVIAKGTAFSVTRADDGISVEVTEGIVAVRVPGETSVELAAGERADFTPHAPAFAKPFAESDTLAWRGRKVVITDLTLREAVAEIDRYRPGHILFLADDGQSKVNAILGFDRIDEGLNALAASQGHRVVRVTPWLAIVR